MCLLGKWDELLAKREQRYWRSKDLASKHLESNFVNILSSILLNFIDLLSVFWILSAALKSILVVLRDLQTGYVSHCLVFIHMGVMLSYAELLTRCSV